MLVGWGAAETIDLPVATSGFGMWTDIVASAMSYGGKSQEESLEALKSFQDLATRHLHKQGQLFTDASHGNFTSLIEKFLKPKMQIDAPVFFDNSPRVGKSSGMKYEPCAVVINPTAVAIGATGINISPQGISVAPTGVNVNPFGLSISPSVIVVAPFDTTIAGQGLNIAPALIAIAPVKTVYNPVGPLNIGGSVVTKELPALP
ncbi:hypothetical protein COCSUDRAFT_36877 [Coccomyxa subellipsoidea C-169]|uniref:Uncharacterized protein n=1 Tax=Coccomyxa subellipsoidea (strain C-169) TaxID=574566 RepID=I0YWS4_COCSC|nr:hypothetical protein COCSUDRAFT_36877 [Coccomyxa subellipsoidea C-169]EIE22843.1 hypothetical protein COCSUDRAFT_36877 [Coccomyxa subellipsoidea C-169]|eukprot:XP_005647387.1 hypothetical protein COCSUDRAFT_36877 [Coccomyxa subellipsoidea C-169]